MWRSMLKLDLILLVISSFALLWSDCASSASNKVIRNYDIGVALDINADGSVQSIKTHVDSNRVLLPQLREKYKDYRISPRQRNGVSVPATIQAIVPVQAMQGKDEKISLVFKDLRPQAVRLGGRTIDYAAINEFFKKRGETFTIKVKIKQDGSVADIQVGNDGLRTYPDAIALIKEAVSTWQYAVDIEAGSPLEMSTSFELSFGHREEMRMAPQVDGPMQYVPDTIRK